MTANFYLPEDGLNREILETLGFVFGQSAREGRFSFVKIEALPEGWEHVPRKGDWAFIKDDQGHVRIADQVYYEHGSMAHARTKIYKRFEVTHDDTMYIRSARLHDKEQYPEKVDNALVGIKDEELWDKLPLTVRQDIIRQINTKSEEIVLKALPDFKNPLSYWGEDCSAPIQQIVNEFKDLQTRIEGQVRQALNAGQGSQPSRVPNQ